MRILIVGGGIAGLTLAALLRQRDMEPTVLEKAREYGEVGYLLSIWPLGSRVLRGLGLAGRFRDEGAPFRHYTLFDGSGRELKRIEAEAWMGNYGEARTVSRAALLRMLKGYGGGVPVRNGMTVQALEQRPGCVVATLSDGTQGEFDLVVGCDGIRSRVRELLFGNCPIRDYGWTAWGCWFDPGIAEDEVHEYWGAGAFLGVYPTRGAVASFAVLPDRGPRPKDVESRKQHIRQGMQGMCGSDAERLLGALDGLPDLQPWPLEDVAAPSFFKGRVALAGDAGAAFLPTAGIGASVAMEAASVLADELSRADAASVPQSLRFYQQRRRKRTLALQDGSRWLLRLMMLRNPVLTWLRDRAVSMMGAKQLLGSITRWMDEPI